MNYLAIIFFFIGLIIGFLLGFFGIKMWFEKKMKNIDKNFLNEEVIETFFSGIGHKPTKKQTRNIMEKIKKMNENGDLEKKLGEMF